MNLTNADRADYGYSAAAEGDPCQAAPTRHMDEVIRRTLISLRHYCDREGYDFDALAEASRRGWMIDRAIEDGPDDAEPVGVSTVYGFQLVIVAPEPPCEDPPVAEPEDEPCQCGAGLAGECRELTCVEDLGDLHDPRDFA